MEAVIRLLNLSVIDQPDCDPLKNPNGGDAPMCVSTVDTYRGNLCQTLHLYYHVNTYYSLCRREYNC